MSGKGSTRRPSQAAEEEVEANWRRIFGNKDKPTEGEAPEPKELDNGE